MNKLLPKITLFFCLLVGGLTLLWLPTQADDEPTAVTVEYFRAVALNNAVRLDWSTASERDMLGFRIKRSVPGGSEVYLDYVGDNGFIPRAGSGIMGSTYSVTDNRVQNGQVYTYILMQVESSGNETEEGRVTVTAGMPPTNTPVVITNPGGSGTVGTATARPTTASGATVTPTPRTNQEATSAPADFVTITPDSVAAVASPTRSSSTTNTNQTSGSTTTTTTSNTNQATNNANLNSVSEVFAQEETTETAGTESVALALQTQDNYPGEAATETAVSDPYDAEASEAYPGSPAVGDDAANENVPIPASVIGSTDGYSGAQADEPTNINSRGNASANQSRIFLWIGFIVALLIFATGIIGSILLFSRK